MKELNDDDFDKVFRTRITDEIPEFDNESWLKMEKKLRKRDRRVFYLNASIILLLLSFGFGFYFLNRNMTLKGDTIAGKKVETKKEDSSSDKTIPPTSTASISVPSTSNTTAVVPTPFITPRTTTAGNKFKIAKGPASTIREGWKDGRTEGQKVGRPEGWKVIGLDQQTAKNEVNAATGNKEQNETIKTTGVTESVTAPVEAPITQPTQPVIAQIDPVKVEESTKKEKKPREKRKIPIALAINVGPDFNSTTKVIGGKAKVAFGIGVEVGITKKLSLQTGLNYGRKDYSAASTDNLYNGSSFNATPVDITAECKVLEVPLRASLNVSENKKRTITINAGLSSYMMLRENYVFKYNPALERSNKIMDVRNGGQHILSVLDLSATYNIKLQNKKLALGLEPYVKIPLAGIGENSVPLKSSGLSLKLSYDFSKKR